MKMNKPTGRINSGLRSIYLVLRIVLTCFVLYMALSRCSLLASAEDVVLTPGQTAALIGSSFPVTYHNPTTGLEVSLTANLIGSTSDVRFDFQPPLSTNIPFHYRQTTSRTHIEPYNYSHALIYAITFPNIGDFEYANSSAFYNLRFDFSISLNGLNHFEMPIFYSSRWQATYGNRSDYTLYTSLGAVTGQALNQGGAGIRYYQAQLFRSDTYNEDNSIDYDKASFYNVFGIDVENSNDFSVSGLSLGLNAVDFAWKSSTDYANSVWILIECPVLTAFPEETTTIPSSTTQAIGSTVSVSIPPAQTVDLSGLESGVYAIGEGVNVDAEYNRQNAYYNACQVEQLNTIITQLNQIYGKMTQSGEIAVDLVGGFDWSLNTDVANFINNAVTSYTMASITPSDYFATPNNIYDLLGGYNWLKPFAVVGGFSTAFGIFCWFVFRGRKGG